MITSEKRRHLPMFILDVLRHDEAEQLRSILSLLNNAGCIGWRDCWPRDFTSEDVIPVLAELVRLGQVRLLAEGPGDDLTPRELTEVNISQDLDKLWFELTESGRQAWAQWEPPAGKENVTTK